MTASTGPANPTTAASTATQSQQGLSGGAIGGIAVGALIGGAFIATLGFLLYRHQPRPAAGAVGTVGTAGPVIVSHEVEPKVVEVNTTSEMPSSRLQYPE